VLGEADLNLSDYSEGDYKVIKLTLEKCMDPNAYIEVGLRATPAEVKKEKKPKTGNADSNKTKEIVNEEQVKLLLYN
jgi:hypothetical protein